MIEACIFDMDGVIVDTAASHYESWKILTRDWDFDFPPAANEALKGASRQKSLDIILELAGIDKSPQEKEALCAQKNEIYLDLIQHLSPADALPGVTSLLQQLRVAGVRIALGSASRNAKNILKLLQLEHYFDVTVDGNDVSRGKPDPQVFLKAADQLGVDPAHCLVFEDAAKGIEAAHAAGMKVIGVGSKDALGDADWVISDLEGLEWAQTKNRFIAA